MGGRRAVSVVLGATVVAASMSWSTSNAEPLPPAPVGGLAVYEGTLGADAMAALVALGIDRRELEVESAGGGDVAVEVILTGEQAAAVAAAGGQLTPADNAADRRVETTATGVFRPYGGPGGLQAELIARAAAEPRIARYEVIGQTVLGTDIGAVRVTGNVARTRAGRRPTTVFVSAQHAREWITPEMTRRLLALVLDGYGRDRRITRLVDTTELWFVPVANPDGYDRTFEPGQRLWRKNVRDSDGDGVIEPGDGVDLNRNWPTHWGYDDEGSSPDPSSDTYRGPGPGSEPETQALDALFARITPEFLVNYHSAAELLLYGIGWQVATPSPDDVLYEAMAGDDATPAVPGYDPDISAELYTTNGETTGHMQEVYGTLGFTPEMATCESASASDPDDDHAPEQCGSGFEFPDDEALIQAEFAKNVPFALAVAESAEDPADPVSVVGRDAEDFRVDSFEVSYGDPQTVAVTVDREVHEVRMRYRINGGRTRSTGTREWQGGERYGHEHDDYYAERRGTVRGTEPGDRVEVWFTGVSSDRDRRGDRRVRSESFDYTVAQDTGNDVLIIANEDRTGVNPEPTPSGVGPKYLDIHVAALTDVGVTPDVWDVDAQGVPHDLGVLSHYAAVLWYLGDNRLTQDPEDFLTSYFGQELEDLAVAERQQYLTIAVRDFLNEGGKLVHAGETTAYYGAGSVGGIYYGLDGAPEEDCVVTSDPFADCLLLADDFSQYYLGVASRNTVGSPGVVGWAGEQFDVWPLGSVDEGGAFVPLSDVLPPEEFPWFGPSVAITEYYEIFGPFLPRFGDFAFAALHADDAYMRMAATFDLTAVAAADAPTVQGYMSVDAETGYDHVIVEAHVVGTDEWTTLPELNGATSDAVPAECEAGFLLAEHPFLEHYLTPGDPCSPSGTTGTWSSITGTTGWIPVAFDLSAYAGQQVEVSISYVSDPFTGGVGVMVESLTLVAGGAVLASQDPSVSMDPFVVAGPPPGSPGNAADWHLTGGVGGETRTAVVGTEDSVTIGFGLEQLSDPEDRATAVALALQHLTEP